MWPQFVQGQLLFSHELLDGLTKKKKTRKGKPEDLRCKTVDLRWEDIQITTTGDITTTQ